MRKTLITVAATCAVLVLAPASALAHGDRGHGRGHHGRHLRVFGEHGSSPTQSQSPAGTVQSFTGGVLTIALSNGSTVSGAVSDGTRLICPAAEPAGQQGSGWQDHHGSWADGGGSRQGGDDQGQGDDEHAQSCSTTNLTPGAVVQAAELRLSGAGPVWDVVVLAPASTTSSTTP